MIDDFKTLTLRLDVSTRTASAEGPSVLHYGDSLKVVVSGIYGASKDALTLGFLSPTGAFYSTGGTSFSWVPGCLDAAYVTVSLDSAPLATAMASVEPGTPVPCRIFLVESGAVTWLDMAAEILPSPLLTVNPVDPQDPFVPRSALIGLAASVSSMPTLTAAQREARMQALLSGLAAL